MAMASYPPSSSFSFSSSSSSSFRWDVFLSFRGEDTRTTFTAHLYTALRRNGINTFMDDKLRSGDEISPTLLKAIEESEISIIVLSKNYASSRWCLDELIKILDCRKTRGQQVLPLFYYVTPSEVRHQTNTVGEAFAQLEKWYKDDEKKVKMWKSALTQVAALSGWPLENRNEPEFIHKIIEWVNSILVKKTYLEVARYPVGIESRVQYVKSLLDIAKNDSTCMVGIFGTGGIGKTTIAKAIYNSMASQFEGSCFLRDIRETSGQMDGLIRLQKKLLSEILGGSSPMIGNVDQGITLIEKRLRLIRVLLVLDDVDQLDQLQKLAGKTTWFGVGSRIIITTRDKHLLCAHEVDSAYLVNGLDHNEALQLFSWHAFNRNKPDDDFVDITKDAVSYAGGLPLALTLLGSTLKGRKLPYWESKLAMYKLIPHDDIQKKLRISFDGLDENAKNIFLDIACFFRGRRVEEVTKILDCTRGSHSYSVAIEELMDKCLVTQSWFERSLEMDKCLVTRSWFERSLEMHDLLQEMGREIIRQESPDEPGKRSRLWYHKDVRDVLEGNAGTNKVEGILIDLPKPDLIHLSSKAFKNMTRLKIFINRNAHFFEEPNFLSKEIRLLDWNNYSGEFLPSNLCGKNLVVLIMHQSQLKELKGIQNFQNLTIMKFIDCEFLRKIPNVSRTPHLEELDLSGCKNLVEVHPSIGFHDKLVSLKLEECYNLRSFPRSLKMRSLKFLSLWHCSSLENFPEIECQMECLEYINLALTGIKELPSSFGYLVGVRTLGLTGFTNHMTLSDSIHKLKHLEILHIGCLDAFKLPSYLEGSYRRLPRRSKVAKFPKIVEDTRQPMPEVESIEESTISSVAELLQLPPLANTSGSNLFRTLNCCSTLIELDLSMSDIVTIPPYIRQCVRLKDLFLNDCEQLREILGIPPNLIQMHASGCVSLEIFLEEARRSPLFNAPEALFQVGTIFPELILGNRVPTQSEFLIQRDCPSSLAILDLSRSAIVSLPTWLNTFVGLDFLQLNSCNQLEEIPELPPNIRQVRAGGCMSLERFQFNNIKDLPRLDLIDLSNCHGLHENMLDDLQIHLLSEWHLKDHHISCIFPGNKIPDYFSHRKELSNTHLGEIDINEPLHLDSGNAIFAFSAVIGREDAQRGGNIEIHVEVINDIGQHIYSYRPEMEIVFIPEASDNVWLRYHIVPHHSLLKTDNFRVIFRCKVFPLETRFFKSCGFHLQHRYEEEAIIDDIQIAETP
ncbi:disease resistance protein RPV1-like [Alnus glutinosa]|uniref:disease resistance protein RPV1-like n=1 Tax=Alnus glutinosa TaxID=3517 RepID=UPI002D7867D0|nr:disease resistance protein RPV1-like [Alnus glutinosa]